VFTAACLIEANDAINDASDHGRSCRDIYILHFRYLFAANRSAPLKELQSSARFWNTTAVLKSKFAADIISRRIGYSVMKRLKIARGDTRSHRRVYPFAIERIYRGKREIRAGYAHPIRQLK
jgi:hypothetical protein